MATNTHVSNARACAAVNALLGTLSGGTLKIYTGSQPATPDVALSGQTLLVTLNLSSPAFGNAVQSTTNAVATAATVAPGVAVATGTAAWFRCSDASGNAVMDGTVGTSAADLILSSTTITTGDTIAASAWTVTLAQ